MRIEVLVRSVVYPTEDESKVIRAMENLFPMGKFEVRSSGEEMKEVFCKGYTEKFLGRLYSLLREERILNTARKIIKKNYDREEGKIRLFFNKQAAYVGRLNFTEGETPLGPIEVEITIEEKEFRDFLDWMAPRV
ncbi:hypothetical protein B6U74_05695 [Candidatus Bathyarchaeota archaeon ex4484_205]|nr:MAG: hypothetical protein B6U74_05695 [Candidatus Bathyarchaeota archaeon ex4484_205]RLF90277.1 MAG: hypothetical protein DRN46_03975 [Thermococci archaeon]RLF96679.1 MAG: hypothetical protein DRN52_01995 [Thermococci archaeon]